MSKRIAEADAGAAKKKDRITSFEAVQNAKAQLKKVPAADSDDDSSDEVPKVAAKKAKVASPKAKPAPMDVDSDDSSDDAPKPKAKAKAKPAADSDDSSDDAPKPKAKAKAKPAADSDDSSDDAPKPKAKAKAKPAADSDDSSDDAPKPKAKAQAKAAADSDDSSDDAPKPKAKAKAKPAADSDDSSDDAPKAKAKAAAKKAADSDDSDEEMPAAAPSVPHKKIEVDGGNSKGGGKGEGKADNPLKVFVGGLPFSADEATVRKDFTDCGEFSDFYMPMNDEGKPRGFALITFTTKAGVEAALKFDQQEYGGRWLSVKMSGDREKGKGKDGKGKDGKGKGKGNQELTTFIRGLPFSCDEDSLRKDFADCGPIVSCRLPKNEEGNSKGIAFVEFETKEGFEAALKFDSTEYGGRTINVAKAGDPPAGKDGKDKGKGKGKDKGKKGKNKSGLSAEKMGAQTGAMVESTGTKVAFEDSDDE